jgi:hypothetical protein
MWSHFYHYLLRVADFAITLGGTSRVGFFGLLLVPPIVSGFESIQRRVRDGETWMKAIQETHPSSLFKKPVFIIWFCLLIWAFGAVTYQDHEGLVAAKKAVIADKNALATNDQKTIVELRGQLGEAKNPSHNDGPAWTFEPVPGENGGGIALITANSSIANLAFRVKCNLPCSLNAASSQAIGTQTGIWLDPHPTSDPSIIRVKVRTPNRLSGGQQIALSFWPAEPIIAPNPPKQISILWVHIDKEDSN